MELFRESQRRGQGSSSEERKKERKRCPARLFSNPLSSFRLVMTLSGVKSLSIKKRKGHLNLTLTVRKKNSFACTEKPALLKG
jgi:hypothetical protein